MNTVPNAPRLSTHKPVGMSPWKLREYFVMPHPKVSSPPSTNYAALAVDRNLANTRERKALQTLSPSGNLKALAEKAKLSKALTRRKEVLLRANASRASAAHNINLKRKANISPQQSSSKVQKTGGQIKIYTGPKNGKFKINKHGIKVYIDSKSLNNNVQYIKKTKAKKL